MDSASERDTEKLAQYLKNTPLSEEPEKYNRLLQSLYQYPGKIEVLKRVFSNTDNCTMFLGMGSVFFSGMKTEQKEDCGVSILAFLSFSRKLCRETGCDYDLLCKIVFSYLEKTRFRFLEVKNEVFSILEEVQEKKVSLLSHALSFLLTEQPVAILSEILLFLQEDVLIDVLKYVTEESEKSKNMVFQKNVGSLLVLVGASLTQNLAFGVLEVYIRTLSSEVQGLRNASIESMGRIAAKLTEKIKESNKGERELSALTSMVCERLLDVSFYCRSRAIQTLTEMLENETMLISVRQKVVDQVLERILDKTHIVRKRAILFFKKALETHPFGLDGGVLNKAVISKAQAMQEKEYYRDCLLFHASVQHSIANLKEVLHTGAKGEATEIIQYLSSCTTYGIEEAMDVFPFLFSLAWSRAAADGKNITDTLAEEIKRMGEGDPRRLIKLMVRFDTAALSYEGIIRELTLRGVLNMHVVQALLSRIGKRDGTIQHLRLLRRIAATDKSATEAALEHILSLLSEEKDSAVLSELVGILGNLDYRVGNDSKVIVSIQGLLEHSCAESLSLLQSIIDTFYLISVDPDTLAVHTLERLSKAGMLAPLVFAVGHIAIKEAVHLERLEAAWNFQGKPKLPEEASKKAKKDAVPHMEIRERRLSVGSRRNSLKITTEEQEEMADRVFFAKEHEVVFGENAALKPFIEMLQGLIDTPDPYLKKLSFVSLGKIMVISSEFNARHMEDVLNALREGPDDLKVVCLMIIADSILAFSSLVGDISHHLFFPLREEAASQAKTVSLMLIRHLLRTGMIKIKGKHWIIAQLLVQENAVEVQRLFEEIMERDTPLKTICEVIKSYAKETQHLSQDRENHAEADLEEKDRVFLEVVQILAKIAGVHEVAKKLQDWASNKTDPVLIRVCTLALSELSKGVQSSKSDAPHV
ncbi:condensin complex subunit 1 [Nematocida sp. AWRm77]|nr:condensin complex subunit 1 [Nematocida sp. AWRm77]